MKNPVSGKITSSVISPLPASYRLVTENLGKKTQYKFIWRNLNLGCNRRNFKFKFKVFRSVFRIRFPHVSRRVFFPVQNNTVAPRIRSWSSVPLFQSMQFHSIHLPTPNFLPLRRERHHLKSQYSHPTLPPSGQLLILLLAPMSTGPFQSQPQTNEKRLVRKKAIRT